MSVHCGPSDGLGALHGRCLCYITPADRKVPPWRREGPSKRQRDPSRAPLGGLRCTRYCCYCCSVVSKQKMPKNPGKPRKYLGFPGYFRVLPALDTRDRRGSLPGLPYCCSAGLTLATVVGEPHCCSVVTVNTSNTVQLPTLNSSSLSGRGPRPCEGAGGDPPPPACGASAGGGPLTVFRELPPPPLSGSDVRLLSLGERDIKTVRSWDTPSERLLHSVPSKALSP